MANAADKLIQLIHLDIDAALAYAQAIENVDMPEVAKRLTEFRRDHERHIDELSIEVRRLGGEPPERKRDVKGFFIEKFTAIRSKTGTEGALKAMRMNEELTNITYETALKTEMPESARAIVLRNRDDERRHLAYIQNAIKEKLWESREKRSA